MPNHQSKQIDLTYWVERNFNSVEDSSIAHMRSGTEAVLMEFMAISGVPEALAACRVWARQRFAELMQDDALLKLYGRLLLAGDSKALPRETSLQLINAYRGLNAKG